MAKKPKYNMSGNVPEEAWLDPHWAGLRGEPRDRRWVIGQVVNLDSGNQHPEDDQDNPYVILQFRRMTAITDGAACDQLAAMDAAARQARPGQQAMEFGEEAGDGPADELAAAREARDGEQ